MVVEGGSTVVVVTGGRVVVLVVGTVVVVVNPLGLPTDLSSWTTPATRTHCQGCTTPTRMSGVELTVKLVVSSVVESESQARGCNGMVAPSAVLQSRKKSNTPRPRPFTSRRQLGWLPSPGPR